MTSRHVYSHKNNVESSHDRVRLILHVFVKLQLKKSTHGRHKKLFDENTYLQASDILFTMAKENDIQVADIIHHTKK